MTVHDLPMLNAVLNATSAILLLSGYLAIRAGHQDEHRRRMIAALISSTIFLVSYVTYHVQVGSVRFQGQGVIRPIYFAILISHTILAVAIVPLVVMTVLRAYRKRWPEHRRLAQITLPLWLYVSITGVVIYGLLYQSPWSVNRL